jgi:hypothetical protein
LNLVGGVASGSSNEVILAIWITGDLAIKLKLP